MSAEAESVQLPRVTVCLPPLQNGQSSQKVSQQTKSQSFENENNLINNNRKMRKKNSPNLSSDDDVAGSGKNSAFSSIKSVTNFPEPPRSINSRIGQRQKQRDTTHKVRFITQLRHAFEDVDIENTGKLNEKQWQESELKEIIHDGNLSQIEFQNYFKRIDVNNNNYITWSELIHYLMKEIASVDIVKSNEAVKFIEKTRQLPHQRNAIHRELVKMITQCQRTGEYITLSDDSIKFWNPNDLAFKRSINDPGFFSACLVFESTLTLAVTTTSRRLIFFNLDTLQQLPVEISASPSPKKIHNMTIHDAKTCLKILESPQMPMFNIPSTMCNFLSTSNETGGHSFFVGDDQGIIEAFRLVSPHRRQGNDFQVDRIGRSQIHNRSSLVTQIISIESLDCYASSSYDKTVKFWKYDQFNKSFTIFRVFQDDQPVVSIIYSPSQKVLATCSTCRDAFVWSISPPRKSFKLGGHYNQLQLITQYVTTTNEKYLLTMTNKKEFRLWDSVNYRLVREWNDPLNPEFKYTAAFFDERRHFLLTAHYDIIKWAEDSSALMESMEVHTHRHPIIGCFLAKEFDEIITVDSSCSIRVWDISKGTLSSSHNETPIIYNLNNNNSDPTSNSKNNTGTNNNNNNKNNSVKINTNSSNNTNNNDDKESDDNNEMNNENNGTKNFSNDLCCATLDCSGRRLITSDFQNHVQMRNYNSGGDLADLQLPHTNSLITILCSHTILGRDYLIRAGWDKTIALFCETEQYNFELYREFVGHSSDISAVVGYSQGIVSGSVNGEIFSWSFDTNAPIAAMELVPRSTVEFLLVFEDDFLFVGDSNCTLSIFSLPKLIPIDSYKNCHSIYDAHCSLSSAVYEAESKTLCTADTLGYVKSWKVIITDPSKSNNSNSNQSKKVNNVHPSKIPLNLNQSNIDEKENTRRKIQPVGSKNSVTATGKHRSNNISPGVISSRGISSRGINGIFNENGEMTEESALFQNNNNNYSNDDDYNNNNNNNCCESNQNINYLESVMVRLEENDVIQRLNGDEILKMIIKGEFLICCGVGMCVRVFRRKDFAYLGFFNEESRWKTDDESTWEKKLPFEKDEKHFKRTILSARAQLKIARSIRIMPTLLNSDENSLSININNNNKQNNNNMNNNFNNNNVNNKNNNGNSFDFEEFGKTIDEYIQGGVNPMKKIVEVEKFEKEKNIFKEAPQLQLSMRPIDLIHNFDHLLSKIEASSATTSINFGKNDPNNNNNTISNISNISNISEIPLVNSNPMNKLNGDNSYSFNSNYSNNNSSSINNNGAVNNSSDSAKIMTAKRAISAVGSRCRMPILLAPKGGRKAKDKRPALGTKTKKAKTMALFMFS